MSMVVADANAKSASIYAEVIRADGTRENLGLISYYHRNPVINYAINTYISLRDKLNGRSRPE